MAGNDPPGESDRGLHDALARLAGRLERGVASLHAAGVPAVGASPSEVVWSRGPTRLLRFAPRAPRRAAVPLLLVYSLTNRHYITDLEPGRSLVEALLDRGLVLYLVDWGYPGPADAGRGLGEYIGQDLHECVTAITETEACTWIDLLGICQGGTFSLCYAALEPGRVRRLVTVVTPVDFHAGGGLLASWVRHVDVDALVAALGNVPGALLNWLFLSLKPLSLSSTKYLDLLERLERPAEAATFLRMERWISDSPDQAGRAFVEFVKGCYQENRLVRGELAVGGRLVDLRGALVAPVLNVYAAADHIVPPDSARALGGLLERERYRELCVPGGHIGVFVSRRARAAVAGAVADFLLEARAP